MSANWLRQFLIFFLLNIGLFLTYCLVAIYLPLARLSRHLRHIFRDHLAIG